MRVNEVVGRVVLFVECGVVILGFFCLMRRRPPRSTQSRSSAASDVYKRQVMTLAFASLAYVVRLPIFHALALVAATFALLLGLSLIHISEPTRPY